MGSLKRAFWGTPAAPANIRLFGSQRARKRSDNCRNLSGIQAPASIGRIPCSLRATRLPAILSRMAASVDRPSAETGALANLNARSREIFRRIVDSYLATGRAGRIAAPVAPAADLALAGLGAQRDAGSRGTRPHLRAPRQRRPAADPAWPALLRRRAAGDRRPRPRGAARGSTARSARPPKTAASRARCAETTSLLSDLTRGAGVVLTTKTDRAAQAHRIRAARDRQGAGCAGRRGRLDREPRDRHARGSAGLGAARSEQLISTPECAAARLRRRRAEIERRATQARGRNSTSSRGRLVDAGLASWAGVAGSREQLIVRGQANLLDDVRARRRP